MVLKKCSSCKNSKLFAEFYPDKTKKTGYSSSCIACQKKRYQENKEIFLKKNKEWREQNKDHYLKKKRESSSKWQKANKDKVCSISMKYKAAKLKAVPPWLSEEDKQAIDIEYALSSWCSEVMGIPYHVDHIIPLQGKQVCGLHVPWNLQVLPASVNIAKSNRMDY
jgi:hypothetical protein